MDIGDVGGQKTLRSYWRNYFEKTDALIWVVDATDRQRIEDCKRELHGLLQEEVPHSRFPIVLCRDPVMLTLKTETVRSYSPGVCQQNRRRRVHDRRGDIRRSGVEAHPDSPVACPAVQRHDGREPEGGSGMGGRRCKEEAILVLRETTCVIYPNRSLARGVRVRGASWSLGTNSTDSKKAKPDFTCFFAHRMPSIVVVDAPNGSILCDGIVKRALVSGRLTWLRGAQNETVEQCRDVYIFSGAGDGLGG